MWQLGAVVGGLAAVLAPDVAGRLLHLGEREPLRRTERLRERSLDLGHDRVQVGWHRDSLLEELGGAPVEQGKGAEDLFDLGVAAGVLQADHVAVAEIDRPIGDPALRRLLDQVISDARGRGAAGSGVSNLAPARGLLLAC